MPFRGRESRRNGVDLDARTAEIERLALAGVYHFEIARRLGASVGTVESTMRILRERGPMPSMRGPRSAVVEVDWQAAAIVWADLSIATEDAVRSIGCAERTIYRKLGNRGARVERKLRVTDNRPEFDQHAYDEASADFWEEFVEATPVRKLWDAAAASGYKRGYAAAKAEFTARLAGVLDEIAPPPPPLLIEGPKPAIAEPAEELPLHPPVAPDPPKVAQKAPELLNRVATAAPPPELIRPASKPDYQRAPSMPWTAERVAKVREAYPTFPIVHDVLAALNALPGEQITMQQLRDMASGRLGLRRPSYDQRAVKATHEIAQKEPLPPPVESVPLAPPRPPPAPASKPAGPGLPEARADGFIYASFACIKAWADGARLPFDGRDVDRLNLARKFQGLPPVVVDWVPETSG